MNCEELRAKLEELHVCGYGWAVSCCRGDRTEAEDVLQTVYLKILEGKAVWRGESSFQTWFFAVIRKTAIDYKRRAWVRNLFGLKQNEKEETKTFCEDVERLEEQKLFLDALEKLPQRQREVLHLVFYHEMSLSEAAKVMSISIGSVRQHYERGKKRLREMLEEKKVYESGWNGKETTSIV